MNLSFDNNLYWNDGNAFPTSSESIVEVSDDSGAIIADPLLPDPSSAPLPRWNPGTGSFGDGSSNTIAEVFENLVLAYGVPAIGSAAIGAADPLQMPADDILGNARSEGGAPDVGAFEKPSCVGAGEGEPCNDGNACTANDACSGGTCTGDPLPLNGTVCDDGNACTANDLCSAAACSGNAGAADGQTCDDGDACSHGDQCSAGVCTGPAEPKAGCVEAERGTLDLRDRIVWTWKGSGVTLPDLGDPTVASSYRLCVYEADAAISAVAASSSATAGGTCGTRPCWKSKPGKGFQYNNRDGSADGLTKLRLTTNAAGASIKLMARGAGFVQPSLPLGQDPAVVAQLLTSNAGCWQTTLTQPAIVNDPARFRDAR